MDHLQYYHLTQEPFSIMPLTQFYFHSEQHDRALERLHYAVSGMKGLAVLVGDIGLGKTLLARRLLETLPESEYEVSLLVVLHEDVDSTWLLKRIAAQVGVENVPDQKVEILTKLLKRLNEIAEQGKKTIVLIDEAHMLRSKQLMEEIRGLLNLELETQKLISLVLFGLPELDQCLNTDAALAQRIAVRFNLKPLSGEAVNHYIEFRLSQAGATQPIFSGDALQAIHQYSKGIPRLINVLCDNSLFEGYVRRASMPLGVEVVTSVSEDLGLVKQL
ncbi:MAG: AAA family ATPase [Deltaproteobacteria bacterium RIFCSPLOWO2_12_FULL_44_12]|nr:MAG: AAA family ATPase [Deltaproteobacteria bacterium RIFCSPHIGHO2_01_FULL_43_49]OGQ14622.1 MAG: AAA family ATPase [Deltaproteobacteria bacterium RIFCSPHIGHO2_02_FULL_44_53]OGQ28008.1 MAG: AAA family ATPase [Deltaproteobacteria bacterium RIFCSPHIGHO2_12_FULL_44_21]OGQ31220.1 MAG: AAA family ATPase [Deltaproteobacteria bacterium RIFCSPLOWO2_01_FULL_45_74]OGQ43212.1 MAG: AAA family ATPase [Deltaproteobacteria bacterium RIFCSPLOWO2_02_FULL_44_34]OGQ70686.1 MAG: AAA family ATPase [Deltaproteoba